MLAALDPPPARESLQENVAIMSSTLAASLHDHDPNKREPRNDLSAAASPNDGDSVSPNTINHFETPGASSSAVSCYSDYEEDPFFGVVDFSNTEGVPSFLDDAPATWQPSFLSNNVNPAAVEPPRNAADSSYPLTPDQTASIHTSSPRSERRAITRRHPDAPPVSISPQELQKPFRPDPIITQPSQLTPSQSSSARTSEDGLAPTRPTMPAQSPRVTVTAYDQENGLSHTHEHTFGGDSPTTTRGGFFSAGDLISSRDQHPSSAPRDASGRWQRDPITGQAGLDPRHRSSDEVTSSVNELAKRRQSDERDEQVGNWLSNNLNELSAPEETQDLKVLEQERTTRDDGISLADSYNVRVPGQAYYQTNGGGPMTDQDREIIAADRTWGDAPMMPDIMPGEPGRYQPPTAQAAIERFERMCRDNDSILSRQATWGTRRRSIHSTADIDVDGILSGNFLKKLTISKNTDRSNKAGSLLKEVRGFIRRPSISSIRKRRGSNASIASNASDDGRQEMGAVLEKRDSTGSPHLAPPDRTSSWGKRGRPNVVTSVGSSGNTPATADNNHARKRSIGATSITSPRSFLQSLKVDNTLQRPRSRSEAPKSTITPDSAESHPNILGLWKASGGPPVASLSRTSANIVEPEEDDDDDDDLQDDSEMRVNANLIDKITPNFTGFQQHVLELNPQMDGQYNYLVDRIAQQQIVRYKTLLSLKVKHLGLGANCPCGSLCIALGGQANVLEQKGEGKGLDPLTSHFVDDDDGATPTDGAITQDSFPQDIPMPPTQYLPAEFECQLCYSRKKFNKPSDWTKHVHEDVQPFTCTWDRCRDAKSFKRKADWVRHENEGHRHLEWWRCDVEECRHTCYRRDNFLQHLVREHKFPEPKVKTKAAIKKAGGMDPTWKKVEECHELTSIRPQEEPCRFCGKTFPTWKKLTVHLAKHMEQISLPVLRLVAAKAKEISADTIISPVQDPPPRTIFSLPPNPNPTTAPVFVNQGQMQPDMPYPDQYEVYPVMPPHQQQYGQPNYYTPQYDNMGHTLQQQPPLSVNTMNQGFGHGQMHEMPGSSSSYAPTPNQYIGVPSNNIDSALEPFPQLADGGLGVHNPAGGGMGTHMSYNHVMDPSTASASPFSGHGSASPYSRSPHQGPTGFDPAYDDRRMSGYP